MRRTRAAAALWLPLMLGLPLAVTACGTDSEVGDSATTSTPNEATGSPSESPSDATAGPAPEGFVDEACPTSFTTGRDGDEVRATLEEFTGEGTVWLCSYSAGDSDDRWQQWDRTSVPVALDSAETSVVTDFVAALEPAEENRPCRADFGPVLLLSQEIRDAEQAHLVIEDFGCRDAQVATNLTNTTLGWNEPRLATAAGDVETLTALLGKQ